MLWRKDKKESSTRRPATDYRARQQVFSYHASRSVPEVRTGRKDVRVANSGGWQRKAQQVPIVVAVVVMVVAALYSLWLTTSPRVMLVNEDQNTLAHAPEHYRDYAAELLGMSALNHTKLTIDTNAIESRMKTHFPEILSADVSLPLLGNRPIVQIETVKPAFMLTTTKGNYYVTTEGLVTMLAESYQTRPTDVPSLADQSGLALKPGDQLMTSSGASFINEIVEQLTAKQVKISSLALAPTPYDVWVYIKDTPYYVKFTMQGNARQQAGTYLATRDYLTGKSKAPTSYIDVRAEDRAYIK